MHLLVLGAFGQNDSSWERVQLPMVLMHLLVLGGLFTGLADAGICAVRSTFEGCCE